MYTINIEGKYVTKSDIKNMLNKVIQHIDNAYGLDVISTVGGKLSVRIKEIEIPDLRLTKIISDES